MFLTPILKAEPENGDFVHITYQDLLDSVLQPLLDDDETPEEVKRVLKDYIDSLCTLNDNEKIIAIDMETKELLNKFFENYKDLILAVVTAQAQRLKDEGNDAEADSMEKARKVLARDLEVSRDKTKYRIVVLDGQSKGKELSDLNKGGQDSVVVNAVRLLFDANYNQKDIQKAWVAAVNKEPTDVVKALGDQATFDQDVVTKPSESWLFRLGSNKDNLAERLYVEERGSIINTQTAYNIDYFVYMVNVIGHEKGRNWPIRIEKM